MSITLAPLTTMQEAEAAELTRRIQQEKEEAEAKHKAADEKFAVRSLTDSFACSLPAHMHPPTTALTHTPCTPLQHSPLDSILQIVRSFSRF